MPGCRSTRRREETDVLQLEAKAGRVPCLRHHAARRFAAGGLNLSVTDKLAIAALLDELGVGFIEGGWPGANPNDTAFFAAMADGALPLQTRRRWSPSASPGGSG